MVVRDQKGRKNGQKGYGEREKEGWLQWEKRTTVAMNGKVRT